MKSAEEWIQELYLQPHPEGGYFTQTDQVTKPDTKGTHSSLLYTNIYFLLTKENPSHFHQLTSDELWFFHDGNPLTIHSLTPDGSYLQTRLGLHTKNKEKLHHTVPSGTIFGSTVEEGYALVSCTVIPGFDFKQFRLFTKAELLTRFPTHHKIIKKLAYDHLPE